MVDYKELSRLPYVVSAYKNGNTIVVVVDKDLSDYDDITTLLMIELQLPAYTNIEVCNKRLLDFDIESLEEIKFIVNQGELVFTRE